MPIIFSLIFYFSYPKLFSLENKDLDKEYVQLFTQADKLKRDGKFEDSIKLFEKALSVAKKISYENKECESLLNLGLLYWNIGNLKESSDYYQQALTLAQKSNLKNEIEASRNALEIYRLYEEGKKFRDSGEYQKSIESFNKAIDLARAIDSNEHLVKCLRLVSVTYWESNKLHEFHSLNEEALKIAKNLNHLREEGRCRNNIGLYYWRLNNYSYAIIYFLNASDIAKKENDKESEAWCLNNISLIYQEIGDYEKAIEYLLKALSINQKLKFQDSITGNLNNLGEAYRRMGIISRNEEDFDRSLKYFDKALVYFNECLKLTRETKDKKTEYQVLNNIGSVYAERGSYQNALKYFEFSLKRAEEADDIEMMGKILTNMGYVYDNQGNYEESKKYYDKVINLNYESGGGDILWETYLYRGDRYTKQNNFNDAKEEYKESIRIIEDTRTQINLEELKAKYLGTDKHIEPYYNLINSLIMLHYSEPTEGHDKEAFYYLEKAKARAFLDSIKVSQVDITKGVDSSLLKQEEKLRKERSNLNINLLATGLDPEVRKKISKQFKEKEKEIEDELKALKIKIRNESPAYAAIVFPDPITLDEAQKILPDSRTAFFAYAIFGDYCYGFSITKKDFKIFPLPSRDKIKKQVSEYIRVINDKDNQNFKLGYDLFNMLILPGLDNKIKTIIFIPDDILYFLPFETLITHKEKEQWLINSYNVFYSPSVTSFREIRKNSHRKKAPKDILACGDPDFGLEEKTINAALRELFRNDSINSFRLNYSGRELDLISGFFNEKRKMILKGGSATEEQLKSLNLSGNLADYKIVHFATHSIIDDKIPSNSSILLSLQKNPTEDGLLQPIDIYDLKLNSDLVTLSACETGLGEFIRGEGIDGFNRAFFNAGTSAVLMSLWAVNDQASSQLMARFYRHLRSSESIMDALRNVKLEMINSNVLAHPYYWAGFIVSGKADEVIFPKFAIKWLILGISILLAGGIIFAAVKSYRKRLKTFF